MQERRSRFPNRGANALRLNRRKIDFNLRCRRIRPPHSQPPARARLDDEPTFSTQDATCLLHSTTVASLSSDLHHGVEHHGLAAGPLLSPLEGVDQDGPVAVHNHGGGLQRAQSVPPLPRWSLGPLHSPSRNKNGPILRRAVCGADHPPARLPCIFDPVEGARRPVFGSIVRRSCGPRGFRRSAKGCRPRWRGACRPWRFCWPAGDRQSV